MNTPQLTTDITSLEARAAVHEVLLLQLLTTIYVKLEGGHERLQDLVVHVENTLRQVRRDAPENQRLQAELAFTYFQDMSKQLLAHMNYVSKH